MATYASTVTVDHPRAERISRNLGMIIGKCDITTYSTTGAEITAITKYFKTIKRVTSDGVTDNAYAVRWNTTDKCFHCFTAPATSAAAALTELSSGDAGELNFIAIGII